MHRAKQGQQILLHRGLSKNILLVISDFLSSNEIFSLVKSNKRLNSLKNEAYLNNILINAYMKNLYFSQYYKPKTDFFGNMFAIGSTSTNLTNGASPTRSYLKGHDINMSEGDADECIGESQIQQQVWPALAPAEVAEGKQ